ncbi:MAG: peptidylprolyl isomerase [Planctomycetes bacterium]|nr:peptidylprolyl isomerase [Planctomycetota bacterium]
MTFVTLAWSGLAGANCVIKIAPDLSKLVIEDLDLAATKVLLVTNHGEMTISFRPDKAPGHVTNFLKLCKQGFYDGTKFHRVIKGFMVQGGDPKTKDDNLQAEWGTGDPGYKINAEFNDIKHVRGVLSMARSQDPNSAGSQFYIVHKDSPHLDKQYTAFGNLEKGSDTLDAIANVRCGGPQGSTPLQPVILHQAIIIPAMKK